MVHRHSYGLEHVGIAVVPKDLGQASRRAVTVVQLPPARTTPATSDKAGLRDLPVTVRPAVVMACDHVMGVPRGAVSSTTTCASSKLANSSTLSSSSRTRPLKLSTKGFSHGRSRLDVDRGRAGQPAAVPQAPAMSSGPLSMRRCRDAPPAATRASTTATTWSASQLRPTRFARASRVRSSTMFSSFSLRRSAVSSNWKSSAQTWLGRSALLRRGPKALCLAGSGPEQALGAPQSLRALAVDAPALPAQDRVRRLPAPSRMLSGDGPQPPA